MSHNIDQIAKFLLAIETKFRVWNSWTKQKLYQGTNARKVISEVFAFFVLQCTVFERKSKDKMDVTAWHGIHFHKNYLWNILVIGNVQSLLWLGFQRNVLTILTRVPAECIDYTDKGSSGMYWLYWLRFQRNVLAILTRVPAEWKKLLPANSTFFARLLS